MLKTYATTKIVKIAASAAIRLYIPTGPRAGRSHRISLSGIVMDGALIRTLPYSYCQSGSSGCLRSHSGRRLLTSGMVAKLYVGGGEGGGHWGLPAPQGSPPPPFPRQYDQSRLPMNTNTPA